MDGQSRRGRAGFTLVELMVVIVIIGLLGSIVMINVLPQSDRARIQKVKTDFQQIEMASKLFYNDYGRYPESLQELLTPPADISTMSGTTPKSYIEVKGALNDPWGTPYIYEVRDDTIYLLSYGKDRQQGGTDDITNQADMTGTGGYGGSTGGTW